MRALSVPSSLSCLLNKLAASDSRESSPADSRGSLRKLERKANLRWRAAAALGVTRLSFACPETGANPISLRSYRPYLNNRFGRYAMASRGRKSRGIEITDGDGGGGGN